MWTTTIGRSTARVPASPPAADPEETALMTVDLRNSVVRAVAAADDGPGFFVVADGRLCLTVGQGAEAEVVCELPNIREEREGGYWRDSPLALQLYVHGPWVCVTERFGENATLVNTVTGLVRELSRKLRHHSFTSYSVGFVERGGRTLLIAQTDFNRLDIFDAETGDLRTDREMYSRRVGEPNEDGVWEVEEKNWSWLAASTLHVAPGSAHFLCEASSTMHSAECVYSVNDFLEDWGASVAHLEGCGDSAIRPLTFIDDSTFVVAVDDLLLGGFMDQEDAVEEGYEYKQLHFFTIPSPLTPDGEARWLDPVAKVDCEVFPLDDDGGVKGELHHDKATGLLVALSADGAFLVRLDGSVVEHLPGLSPPFGVFDDGKGEGWRYAKDRRLFYRWRDGVGIEERTFSWAGADDGTRPPAQSATAADERS
ncbi:hypothetical protein EQW78_11345 [Oerskovia turbata]|uniref:WD40 repeat domain-containing protein n=1 Tax=Oerskovia turbata TaxID=1713 RepID=A0A4V1N4U3_9CELL|nr:hypothetical protein [Oerskovia turbata]RXR25800.1 hypothetical protein EQW73_09885 [Oerskovia turbata]RXR33366.1 hypothetical protein EQW78_11345 [Oerskovia turbata]